MNILAIIAIVIAHILGIWFTLFLVSKYRKTPLSLVKSIVYAMILMLTATLWVFLILKIFPHNDTLVKAIASVFWIITTYFFATLEDNKNFKLLNLLIAIAILLLIGFIVVNLWKLTIW